MFPAQLAAVVLLLLGLFSQQQAVVHVHSQRLFTYHLTSRRHQILGSVEVGDRLIVSEESDDVDGLSTDLVAVDANTGAIEMRVNVRG